MDLYWLQRIYDKIVSGVTVTQDAKDRTITNVPTIAPSGDMARKAEYDRNFGVILLDYSGSHSSHSTTVRWQYTVPSNHIYRNSLIYLGITWGATADKYCNVYLKISIDGGTVFTRIAELFQASTDFAVTDTITAIFYLAENHILRGYSYSTDNVQTHGFYLSASGMEFDE